ncbi:MAG TPA: YMGG-like glycine zipper-containing protein [Blastocatellia bacterium]|nr:YMGG-like glycine zipper-containing protein [Blastocatellia bacterium]
MKRSIHINLHQALAVLLFILPLTAFGQKATTKKTTTAKTTTAVTAKPKTTVEYGYVAGYNDGYTSGKTDYNTRASRDFQRSTLYQEANRGYEMRYGNIGEYQNGYRLGYELGYTDGYYGRDANSKMPAHPIVVTYQNQSASQSTSANTSNTQSTTNNSINNSPSNSTINNRSSQQTTASSNNQRRGNIRTIPNDTTLRVRLLNEISTKVNQEGDKFSAEIIDPLEYEGAVIEGNIAKLKRSGRLTGQTELGLEFDRITFRDGRSIEFRAQLERIHESEQVKTVDEEGNVQTSSNTKDTTVRSAGGAALGAVIGAIAGGGKGAAIGALIGASVGAGSVYVQGNKDLVFERGTEMTIKTYGPR